MGMVLEEPRGVLQTFGFNVSHHLGFRRTAFRRISGLALVDDGRRDLEKSQESFHRRVSR